MLEPSVARPDQSGWCLNLQTPLRALPPWCPGEAGLTNCGHGGGLSQRVPQSHKETGCPCHRGHSLDQVVGQAGEALSQTDHTWWSLPPGAASGPEAWSLDGRLQDVVECTHPASAVLRMR